MDPYEIESTESCSDTKELRSDRSKNELELGILLLFINANYLIDIEI